jgi:putative endonuclease
MMNNLEIGKRGEKLAAIFLENIGYEILERNFRFGKAELDLIVRSGNLLVFVEVKMRSDTTFGEPETAVTEKKRIQMRKAAEHYIFETNWQHDIRFDIIAITGTQNPEIAHFEDIM